MCFPFEGYGFMNAPWWRICLCFPTDQPRKVLHRHRIVWHRDGHSLFSERRAFQIRGSDFPLKQPQPGPEPTESSSGRRTAAFIISSLSSAWMEKKRLVGATQRHNGGLPVWAGQMSPEFYWSGEMTVLAASPSPSCVGFISPHVTIKTSAGGSADMLDKETAPWTTSICVCLVVGGWICLEPWGDWRGCCPVCFCCRLIKKKQKKNNPACKGSDGAMVLWHDYMTFLKVTYTLFFLSPESCGISKKKKKSRCQLLIFLRSVLCKFKFC